MYFCTIIHSTIQKTVFNNCVVKKLIPSFVFFSVLLSQLCHSASPTGSVQISGTPKVGNVLTASNDLADADGLGSITYQWKRNGSIITLGGSHQDGINNVDGFGSICNRGFT